MTEKQPSEAEESGAFSVRFEWTPDLIEASQDYLQFSTINTVSERGEAGIALCWLVILSLCGGAYLLGEYDLLEGRAALLALGVGVSVWLTTLVIERGLFKRANEVVLSADQRFRNRLLAMPPAEITFGPEGYKDTSPRGTVTFPWRTFTEIREFQHGIVLMLSEEDGIFILDETLPDGIDRAEASRRFRKWKGPW